MATTNSSGLDAMAIGWQESFLREVTLIPGDAVSFAITERELRMRDDRSPMPSVRELCERAGRPGLTPFAGSRSMMSMFRSPNMDEMIFESRIAQPKGTAFNLAEVFGPHPYALAPVRFTDDGVVIDVAPSMMEYEIKARAEDLDILVWPRFLRDQQLQPRRVSGPSSFVVLADEKRFNARSSFSVKLPGQRTVTMAVTDCRRPMAIAHRFPLRPLGAPLDTPPPVIQAFGGGGGGSDGVGAGTTRGGIGYAPPRWMEVTLLEDAERQVVRSGNPFDWIERKPRAKAKPKPVFKAPDLRTSRKIIFEDE